MAKKTSVKNKFDFEIGYLVKSPCKSCNMQSYLPGCAEDCSLLDKVQSVLASGISCSKSFSTFESYAIALQGWEQK